MKNCILKSALYGLVGLALTAYFDPLPATQVEMPTPTHTIAQVKSLFTGGPYTITDSIVIGGRIISNDQFGNFYRSFYMEDASGAIEVKIGSTGIYNVYPTGSYVCVYLKGMTLGNYPKGSRVQATASIGAADPTGEYENSYIDVKPWIKRAFFRGDINRSAIDTVKISSQNPITDAYINKLVRLRAVLGAPNYSTWARHPLPTGTTAGAADFGQQAVTGTGILAGNSTLIIRTSPYAKFAGKPSYPSNTEVILTGILTKFNTTYQIVLNTETDVVPVPQI